MCVVPEGGLFSPEIRFACLTETLAELCEIWI